MTAKKHSMWYGDIGYRADTLQDAEDGLDELISVLQVKGYYDNPDRDPTGRFIGILAGALFGVLMTCLVFLTIGWLAS